MFHARLVYDMNCNCQSGVRPDYQRTVNIDEKGDERITFEKVDYPKLQESLGDFRKWSLKSLVAAGIDPDFGIKTGFNTRLDGAGIVDSAIEQINIVIDSDSKNVE